MRKPATQDARAAVSQPFWQGSNSECYPAVECEHILAYPAPRCGGFLCCPIQSTAPSCALSFAAFAKLYEMRDFVTLMRKRSNFGSMPFD
mgnify:CR=1 FL=1